MVFLSYIVSWSGGKDSCFACYKTMCSGYKVLCLVNFISKEYKRVSFHGTEARLIQLQAEALSVPLLQKETTPHRYEEEFKEAVRSLIFNGAKGMIFGDIYLEEHKEWIERVCEELKIEAVEPLWNEKTENVLLNFIDEEFDAVVVSAQSSLFSKEWIGHKVDREFLKYLKDNNIDICGENGEYHTLVTNGPIFKKKIEIIGSRPVLKDGYWFLDTMEYSLI